MTEPTANGIGGDAFALIWSEKDHLLYGLNSSGPAPGLASRERYERMLKKRQASEAIIRRLKETFLPVNDALQAFLEAHGEQRSEKSSLSLRELLCRPGMALDDLVPFDPWLAEQPKDAAELAEISVKYEGYMDRQRAQVAQFRRSEDLLLPEDIDYMAMDTLRIEARQKLTAQRPRSIGQAARIPGVSPGDVTVLMVALEKAKRSRA